MRAYKPPIQQYDRTWVCKEKYHDLCAFDSSPYDRWCNCSCHKRGSEQLMYELFDVVERLAQIEGRCVQCLRRSTQETGAPDPTMCDTCWDEEREDLLAEDLLLAFERPSQTGLEKETGVKLVIEIELNDDAFRGNEQQTIVADAIRDVLVNVPVLVRSDAFRSYNPMNLYDANGNKCGFAKLVTTD